MRLQVIRRSFKRAWEWIFSRRSVAHATKIVAAKAPAKPIEEYAEFHFRGTILDQLSRYFLILQRMKRSDPEAYALHSKIGAYVIPSRAYNPRDKAFGLPGTWRTTRPAFGMVIYGAHPEVGKLYDDNKKSWTPFAMYFTKYKRTSAPKEIQPISQGDIYVVSVYWDALKDKVKSGTVTQFPVAIVGDSVRVLKTMESVPVEVRSTHRDRGRTFRVPSRKWRVPEFFVSWANEHDTDPADYLASVFIDAVNCIESARLSMVRIRAFKGNVAAVFSVDVLRTPYFFKDRDATVGPTGKKRRIFHIVRTHTRADGSVVKTHFRGDRKFNWNGYQIEVSVPGWHHKDAFGFDAGAIDWGPDDAPIPGAVGLPEVGRRLSNIERKSLNGFHRGSA